MSAEASTTRFSFITGQFMGVAIWDVVPRPILPPNTPRQTNWTSRKLGFNSSVGELLTSEAWPNRDRPASPMDKFTD